MPVVTTNTAANTALRFLNKNSADATSSISKLASGSRITRASDDAAGLAISSRLSADVTVLQQAGVNAAQAASFLQVGDGGLARIADVLTRLKSLAAQSQSGIVSDTERGFINAEFTQLRSEIDGIVDTTTFNGTKLLDGSANTQTFFVGVSAGDTISVNFDTLSSAAAYTAASLGIGSSTVATSTGAASALSALDTAIDRVSQARATTGAVTSRFQFRGEQIATTIENLQAANSTIKDVDIAAEQSRLVASQVLVQAGVSALSQANQLPQSLLRVLQ